MQMKSLLNGLLAGYENNRSSLTNFYPDLTNEMIQMNDPRRCLSSAGVILERTHTVSMQKNL